MSAIEDAAERAVAAVILFGDLNTATDIRNAANSIARNVLTEVEPLIRTDEREKVKAEYVPVLMEHLRILANLYATVEVLPGKPNGKNWIRRDQVLDLIDGSSE